MGGNSLRIRVKAWQMALIAAFCLQLTVLTPVSSQQQRGGVDSTVPGTALPRYEGLIQTDITTMPETDLPTPPGSKASFFRPKAPDWTYKLPPNFWINASCEAAQRFDSNVFQTLGGGVCDYSFRVQPRIETGWRFSNRFQPYVEYFVIKDVFVKATDFNPPTSQSLAAGVKGSIWTKFDPEDKGLRKTLSYDFRAREWWFNSHQRQYDLLPALIYEQVLRYKSKTSHTKYELRGLLQLDQRKTRDSGSTEEIDPFLSARIIHARGRWLGSAGVTVPVDFPTYTGDKPRLRTGAVIGTIDIARQMKNIPNAFMFVQAQPIWNFSDESVPGYSGFNFRLFSGLRLVFNRSPVTPTVKHMWKNQPQ